MIVRKRINMADDKRNNSTFGAGFMADMLKDLQKQYGYYSRPLE